MTALIKQEVIVLLIADYKKQTNRKLSPCNILKMPDFGVRGSVWAIL